MKLLMITRKVDKNEHLAGFIYNWVKKIDENVQELRVISWQEGDSSGLPENIKVFHLPTGGNKIIKIIKFYRLLFKNMKGIDGLFCHQMPVYTILAAPIGKLYGKKVVSWYMHSQINLKLYLMLWFSNIILSASKESFPLKTKKLIVTGHGIDTEIFKPAEKHDNEIFKIISIGRISPTKDYESMIKAIDILAKQGIDNIKLNIIGEPGLASQNIYFENLKQMVQNFNLQNKVDFLGSKPNREISKYLQQSDLFINMSKTGSIDKAVLEAMACGCLVITANISFENILPEIFKTKKDEPELLAKKISALMKLTLAEREVYSKDLVKIVTTDHNLDNLVKKIITQF